MRALLQWVTPALAGCTFVALLFVERRRPLRRRVEPQVRRVGRNLALLGTSAACWTEVAKRAADSYQRSRLTPRAKGLFSWLYRRQRRVA